MGFSAAEGLPMGTRSNRIDPGVLLWPMREGGMGADAVEHLLYRESGRLALSDVSHDLRAILAAETPRARGALDYYAARAAEEVARMVAGPGRPRRARLLRRRGRERCPCPRRHPQSPWPPRRRPPGRPRRPRRADRRGGRHCHRSARVAAFFEDARITRGSLAWSAFLTRSADRATRGWDDPRCLRAERGDPQMFPCRCVATSPLSTPRSGPTPGR